MQTNFTQYEPVGGGVDAFNFRMQPGVNPLPNNARLSPPTNAALGDRNVGGVGVGGGMVGGIGGGDYPGGVGDLRQRKTTNVGCAVSFGIFWVMFLVITIYSLVEGNPQQLFAGRNYYGLLCGVDEDAALKPYVYWPDKDKIHMPTCVENCPTESSGEMPIPVEKVVETTDRYDLVKTITESVENRRPYNTRLVAGKYCVDSENEEIAGKMLQQQLGLRPPPQSGAASSSFLLSLSRLAADFLTSWPLVLFMMLFSALLSHQFLVLLNKVPDTLLSVMGILLLILGVILTIFCFVVAYDESGSLVSSVSPADTVFWAFIIGIFSLIYVVFLVFLWNILRKRFLSSIKLLSLVFNQLLNGELTTLRTVPFLINIAMICLVIFWSLMFQFVISIGGYYQDTLLIDNVKIRGVERDFVFTSNSIFFIFFYIFALFWAIEFLLAVAQYIVSYCVSLWFFTEIDAITEKKKNMVLSGPHLVNYALHTAGKKHVGTLACGSLLIGLSRPFSFLIGTLLRQFEFRNSAIGTCCNKFKKILTQIFEQFISQYSKLCYVELAINNEDFFSAGRNVSHTLQDGNPSIVCLQNLLFVFEFIGMSFVGLTSCCVTLLLATSLPMFASNDGSFFVANPIVVSILTAILCCAMCAPYMSLFEVAGDALLYCTLEDDKTGSASAFIPQEVKIFLDNEGEKELQRQRESQITVASDDDDEHEGGGGSDHDFAKANLLDSKKMPNGY